MRVGSLFSGALDGLSMGLEWAGMRTAWQVEKDDWRRAQLARLYPHARQYGEIHGLDTEQLDSVDLICGGFPCQPWSCAGRQKGRDDDRDLWPQMRRVIAACNPRWVLGENVPGLDDKRFMALDGVLSDLEDLGYEAVSFEIPACAVNAPHQRARIFIVAHASQPGPSPPKQSGISGPEKQRVCSWPATPERGGPLGAWDDYEWIVGADGKVRRVKPGVRLLAHGVPARSAWVSALGDAVVPQVAYMLGLAILEAAS